MSGLALLARNVLLSRGEPSDPVPGPVMTDDTRHIRFPIGLHYRSLSTRPAAGQGTGLD
jgi:hypothetical protein